MLPGLEYADVERDLNERLVEIAALHDIDIEMRRLVEPVPAFEQAEAVSWSLPASMRRGRRRMPSTLQPRRHF